MPTTDFFRRYLQALGEIHDSLDLDTTQNAVVRNAVMLFGARGAGLMLFTPNKENLISSAAFGLSDAYLAKGAIDPVKNLGETHNGTAVVINDVAADPRVQYREAAAQEGIRSIVGLPIKAGSALAGSLRLYFSQTRPFDPEEMETLQALSLQAGLAIKKAFYFASMKEAVSDIQTMPSTDIKAAMQALLETVVKYSLARGSALLLVNQHTNTLSSVVRYGLSERYISKGPLFVGSSLGEITTGKPVVISDAAADPRVQYKDAAAEENVRAILGLPVRVGEVISGALRLYYPFVFDPGPDYIMWMEHLAFQIGIALEKTQLLLKFKERANWYEDILKDFER